MHQLPGAGIARAGHHHTPTSSGAVLLGKMAYHTKQIRRQCTAGKVNFLAYPFITAYPFIREVRYFKHKSKQKVPQF